MILGIGIDTVGIERFSSWHTYPRKSLLRIFSAQEIAYCLEIPSKSAERFAVRFSAREALLKALGCAYPEVKIPFLTLCRHVAIEKNAQGAPQIQVNFQYINLDAAPPHCHVSLSHTKTLATAIVILESYK